LSATAERLMDLAEDHIRNAGYGGFSFRDLAAEIGITSASVHHHFPTKAIMAAAVARRYGDRFLAAIARRPNETAEDAIATYRSAFRAALDRDGRMCLCGVLGAQAGILPDEVAEEVLSFFHRCVDDLAQRIGGADAEVRAIHVMATLEGAMMLARSLQRYRSIRSSRFRPRVTAIELPMSGINSAASPFKDGQVSVRCRRSAKWINRPINSFRATGQGSIFCSARPTHYAASA
jgi:TetR/AcrR family transcriptional repressor of nem operon